MSDALKQIFEAAIEIYVDEMEGLDECMGEQAQVWKDVAWEALLADVEKNKTALDRLSPAKRDEALLSLANYRINAAAAEWQATLELPMDGPDGESAEAA